MKKFLTYVSLAVILFACVAGAVNLAGMPRTYEGQNASVSVYELQQDPASYDDSQVDGAAAAIVQQNLAETHAVNDVWSAQTRIATLISSCSLLIGLTVSSSKV